MSKNDPALSFPVRGTAGGWRDCWDEPDDHTELRAHTEAIERQQVARAKRLGVEWQREILEDQTRQRRDGVGWRRQQA
jgi:hypothetical protein